jgi:hypothetical protein
MWEEVGLKVNAVKQIIPKSECCEAIYRFMFTAVGGRNYIY